MRHVPTLLLPLFLLVLPPILQADTITIGFDGLADSELVTTQFAGLTFSNTIALSSGISLNEYEFPPNSIPNVVSDNGGPLSIFFSTPVFSVGAYFTYLVPITLTAYDANGNLIATIASKYITNLALSGDPGSSPNEFLNLLNAGGISSITILGDPAGGSFAMDDLTYSTGTTAVPEPSTLVLLTLGGLAIFATKRRVHL